MNQDKEVSLLDKPPLNFRFHNPNTTEDTVDFLVKLLAEANWHKMQQLLLEVPEDAQPGHSPHRLPEQESRFCGPDPFSC